MLRRYCHSCGAVFMAVPVPHLEALFKLGDGHSTRLRNTKRLGGPSQLKTCWALLAYLNGQHSLQFSSTCMVLASMLHYQQWSKSSESMHSWTDVCELLHPPCIMVVDTVQKPVLSIILLYLYHTAQISVFK